MRTDPTAWEVMDQVATELERRRPGGLEQARAISTALDALPVESWRAKPNKPRLDESAWCRRCGQLRDDHGVFAGACGGDVLMRPPLHLRLPYPPSVNTYWRHNRGRTHISNEGRDYRDSVVMLLPGTVKLTGRLAVVVRTHAPDARRRDLDNTQKATLDALAHAGVYDDDSQIDDLRVIRGEPEPRNPHIVVEILELAP